MAEENPEEFSSWCPGSGGGQSLWDWAGEVQHFECTGPDLDNSSEPFCTVHIRSAPTCLVVQSPWSLQAKFQGGLEPAKTRISRQVLNRACLAVRDALQQITPLQSAFHAFLVCPKNRCVLVQTFKPFLVGQNMASLAVKYLFFTTLSYSYQKFGAGKVGIFCLGACEAARIQQARLAWIVQPGLLSALNQAWPAI